MPFAGPRELIAENALLRQQVIVATRCAKKPRFAAHERGLIATLTRLVPRWKREGIAKVVDLMTRRKKDAAGE